jgi:hypothetical protein
LLLGTVPKYGNMQTDLYIGLNYSGDGRLE